MLWTTKNANKFSLRALLNTVSDLKGLIIGAFSEEIINS